MLYDTHSHVLLLQNIAVRRGIITLPECSPRILSCLNARLLPMTSTYFSVVG